MSGKNVITEAEMRTALEAVEMHGGIRPAARALGMAPTTVERHYKKAQKANLGDEDLIEIGPFPDDNIPAEDLIQYLAKSYEKRRASYDAHEWFPVRVNDTKPIGILWFGDPHIDDNGCNWPLLLRHCELCKQTEGLYGANIGDTTNNWAGRLIRLYAEQNTSKKQAQKLARWFMIDSGVEWLLWILGNHDQFGDGAAILAMMGEKHGTKKIVCHDWDAKFRLVFPNKREIRVWASHDFKGHSMWNPNHGPMKAAQMRDEAHLYICGHKHNAWHSQGENVARGLWQHMIRAKGYKEMDNYARVHGFDEQKEGAAVLTVFDPDPDTMAGLVTTFWDIEMGVEFFRYLRGRV